MKSTYRTIKGVPILLLGGTLGAGLMFAGLACQTMGGGKSAVGPSARGVGRGAGPYERVAFNHEQHQAALGEDCATCHHAEPNAAEQACATCHSRAEGRYSEQFHSFVPKLKDVMHDPDTGCRGCHDEATPDGLWDCKQCHTG